jgi:hypothetical protein
MKNPNLLPLLEAMTKYQTQNEFTYFETLGDHSNSITNMLCVDRWSDA